MLKFSNILSDFYVNQLSDFDSYTQRTIFVIQIIITTEYRIMANKYDLLVIGSGPGGYVAAIRASQLGLKVGVVEKAELGGICLNWGCIPTKALLKSANVFEYIQHAKDYGIEVKDASVDFGGMISRSRGVADAMSKGIQFLFKKNKIDIINGFGKLKAPNKVEVELDGASCKNTGSRTTTG